MCVFVCCMLHTRVVSHVWILICTVCAFLTCTYPCSGPELLSSYLGESESNIRQLFARARQNSPCVIFLDEVGESDEMR